MKKTMLAALFLLLVAGMVGAVSANCYPPWAETKTLFADQDVSVGTVTIWDEDGDLHVCYDVTEEDWYLTQTHLAVACDPSGIPQTANGNPIPGLFPEGETFDIMDYEIHACYVVDMPYCPGEYCDGIVVAAHAVVAHVAEEECVDVVSGTNTDVIEVNGATQPAETKAVPANEPFSYPTCSAYTASDASKSVWDNGIGSAFATFNAAPAADWIWNAPNPDDPVEGDVVKFQQAFTVPGFPTSATLHITADNGYIANLNGALVGYAQVGLGFPTTLREEINLNSPQTGDWGVASQGWQTVESYPSLPVVMGANILDITATNEYMSNGPGSSGADFYLSGYNPVGGTRTADPQPIGVGGTSACGQACYNPGGLIYKATVCYLPVDSETAWGDGDRFVERGNWATYSTYTPRCCEGAGLVNGGFEAPVVTTMQGWNIYDSGTAGLGWIVEWAAPYAGAPDPAHLELHESGTVVNAYEGNQYAELDTDWGGPTSSQNNEQASVDIYQVLNTCPGYEYDVDYAWSPRAGNGVDEITVYIDEVSKATRSGDTQTWTSSSFDFTADEWNTKLEFIETGLANSFGMFLDDVSVEFTP